MAKQICWNPNPEIWWPTRSWTLTSTWRAWCLALSCCTWPSRSWVTAAVVGVIEESSKIETTLRKKEKIYTDKIKCTLYLIHLWLVPFKIKLYLIIYVHWMCITTTKNQSLFKSWILVTVFVSIYIMIILPTHGEK